MCCDDEQTWGRECERESERQKGKKARTTSDASGGKSVSEKSKATHTLRKTPFEGSVKVRCMIHRECDREKCIIRPSVLYPK